MEVDQTAGAHPPPPPPPAARSTVAPAAPAAGPSRVVGKPPPPPPPVGQPTKAKEKAPQSEALVKIAASLQQILDQQKQQASEPKVVQAESRMQSNNLEFLYVQFAKGEQ
eukprot:5474-Pyramimonas_sp.AAC.1